MKIRIDRLLIALFYGLMLAGCNTPKKNDGEDPIKPVSLVLVDSLVIDKLSMHYLQDVNLDFEKALLLDKNKELILTDLKGNVLNAFSLAEEGPNGVGEIGAQGYRFLDKNRFVAQGFFDYYYVYDFDGRQVKRIPYNINELYRMTIFRGRTTFHPYLKDGKMMMIGEENNFFSDDEMNPKTLGTTFYEKVRNVYRYNLETEENELLETFPPSWEPRVNQRYVGNQLAMISLHDTKTSFALLPLMGSQLYIYDLGEEVRLQDEIQLQHPERSGSAPTISPEVSNNYSDYPAFRNVLYAGDYVLIQFFTTIPEAKMRELRAISEQYFSLPEFKEARDQYIKPYYILVKNGKQVGVIDEFPVDGSVEFLDKNGIIYINDNISPKVERDYNVFYKVKIED